MNVTNTYNGENGLVPLSDEVEAAWQHVIDAQSHFLGAARIATAVRVWEDACRNYSRAVAQYGAFYEGMAHGRAYERSTR